MEWEKFYALASFENTTIKNQQPMERLHPYLDLFLKLWLGDWRQHLQQLNSAIEKDY
jgi:hypothetical protein